MKQFPRMSVVLLIVAMTVSAIWLPMVLGQVKEPKASAGGSTKPTASKDGGLQEVVAEGAGATPSEALKDAFRNAVRQVVGSVVDAETLVKNDELVEDKVLTYSDGFIKTYDKIAGSEKQVGGIHRVKIKAKVERRSVVAKLKEAKVTVKEVDGKGLFAEAVTQLEAEQDASALLRKAFTDFPQNCLTATVIGKPEIVDKTADKATLRIQVQVEPDLKAYKTFSDELVKLLDKLARVKGGSSAVFLQKKIANGPDKDSIYYYPKWRENEHDKYLSYDLNVLMPKAFNDDGDFRGEQLPIAVATSRTKSADRIEFRYFLVDKSLKSEMLKSVCRRGNGKLTVLDGDDNTIAVDRFPLFNHFDTSGLEYEGTLVALGYSDGKVELYNPRNSNLSIPKLEAAMECVLIAPVFFGVETAYFFSHVPKLTFTRSITLGLDELKSVESLKCEVAFDE